MRRSSSSSPAAARSSSSLVLINTFFEEKAFFLLDALSSPTSTIDARVAYEKNDKRLAKVIGSATKMDFVHIYFLCFDFITSKKKQLREIACAPVLLMWNAPARM
jgi:hypothetical protein